MDYNIFSDSKYVVLGFIWYVKDWWSGLIANRDSAIPKNINLLSIAPLQIHRTATGLSATSTADSNKTLSRIGAFLVSQLQAEYKSKKETINGLKAAIALEKLRDQIITYTKGLWPFNRATTDTNNVAQYWQDLKHHDGADVLAVSHCIVFLLQPTTC